MDGSKSIKILLPSSSLSALSPSFIPAGGLIAALAMGTAAEASRPFHHRVDEVVDELEAGFDLRLGGAGAVRNDLHGICG